MRSNADRSVKKNINLAWISITLLLFLLISYTFYHVFSGTGEIKTTPAGYIDQTSSAVLDGILLRDEAALYSDYSGGVRYLAGNGEMVSADSAVAGVYATPFSEELEERISSLERELDIYRASNHIGQVSVSDVEALREETERVYAEMMRAVNNGDHRRAEELERELLICLNKKKIYSGEISGYNSEIARIEAEIEELLSSYEGDSRLVKTDVSGYFYRSCDGYESELTLASVSELSAAELKNKIAEVKETPTKDSQAVGKMVYDYSWYIACVCGKDISSQLLAGGAYDIILFDENMINTQMRLESIEVGDGENDTLIFSCDVMPKGFSFSRYQSFEIKISSVGGYRIPTSAIRSLSDKDGNQTQGVYILNASIVYFRRVDIIFEGDGYCIAALAENASDGQEGYLELNDLIIVSGDDLYEGKVIKR